ncbi:MAG: LysR family transcriptional regulator [Pseudomonadales bacterium]
MIEKLDVRQMRLLLLLGEKRSISRTSEALDISQQAVSAQLKSLRESFDDRLFVRFGHGVAPTPKAEELIATFTHILDELKNVTRNSHFDPVNINQTFVISATDYAQHVLCTDLFRELRSEAPGLNLLIKDLEIDSLEESLTKGSIDLVITIPEFLPATLPYISLYKESYQLVASKCNQNTKVQNILELNKFDYIIVSPARANLKGSSQMWFQEHGINRSIVASIPSFSMIPEYIQGTDVVAFVPRKMLPCEGLKTIELPEYPTGFEVILAWHPRTQQDPLYQWVITKIKELKSK